MACLIPAMSHGPSVDFVNSMACLVPAMSHGQGWPDPYIHTYMQCIYGMLSREITIHTAIHGVHILLLANPTHGPSVESVGRHGTFTD